MKDKKYTLKYFTVAEYEEEQEYLREEHKNGWKFSSVTFPGIYSFKKCEPEDVIYQLDYNKDRIGEMREYIQMFDDCGWEYICDFVGYSYFRKPVSEMSGEEEIFSDDASKLDMARRVYKGRIIPLIIIFFLIICPQLIAQSHINQPLSDIMFIVFAVMFIVYVILFAKFAISYRKLQMKER